MGNYIVYSLTRQVTAADLDSQRTTFQEMLSRFPEDEAEASLQELLSARAAQP